MFVQMDEHLKFALTLIGGAIGGAFIAGILAVVGAWVADKREHRQWLRDERLTLPGDRTPHDAPADPTHVMYLNVSLSS